MIFQRKGYTAPPPPAPVKVSKAERPALKAWLKAQINGPVSLHDIVVMIQAEPSLSAAVKAKCDGDRVFEVLAEMEQDGDVERA